ncbi:MAG TPA: diguanylate cyclase, partial [Thiolapillus brandeum]|nr:diguanylate cyclase [Thiolapillus brandeum]
MALSLVVVLILVAIIGYRFVSQTSDVHIERIASRDVAQQRVGKLQRQLQKIEQGMALQIIEPGSVAKSELQLMLEVLERDFKKLDNDLLVSTGEQPLMSGETSVAILPNFKAEAITFMHVADNNMLRFPSTYIMQAYMQPRSRTINDTLDRLIFEMPKNSDQEFMRLIYETQHIWQQLLAEFRLVVANRFSVFADNPREGMQARTHNIEIYLEQMRTQLLRLEKEKVPESLQPLPDGIWQQLQTSAQEWQQYYKELMSSLTSSKWRLDLYQFNTILQPQIRKMEEGLSQLRANLADQAGRDITGLTKVTGRLALAILVSSLIGIALIIGAYFYLNVRVLKPMSETAQALRQEASGDSEVVIPVPKLQETRDLVEAFDEMRNQVLKRERGLDHLAHHDPLTKLPNRLLLKDRLDHALEMAKRHDQVLACLFLDLDNFKQINDTLGHLAGDELLIEVARRLQETMRSSDTIARLGGDEFAILLEDIGQKVFAEKIAQKILKSLRQFIVIDDHQFHVTASIGIAIFPDDDSISDDLLRDADAAMYEAKRLGKNDYHFFSVELLQLATQKLKLDQRLRQAVKNKELIYYYQPIVDARTNRLIAAEALLRWKAPEEALKSPVDFIEAMKRLDLDLRKQLTLDLAAQVN